MPKRIINTMKKTSLIEQAAILTVASLLAKFLGFVYRLPLTGMIGYEGNGLYSISYNIYVFFFVLSAAGLPAAISKMVSERLAQGRYADAHRVFKTALLVAVILGMASFVILFFGAGWLSQVLGNSRSYYAIMTLGPTVPIVAIMAVFRGYFLGMGNSVPNAVSQVVDQAFNAIFSVLCAWLLMKAAGETGDALALGAAGGTLGTGIGAVAGLAFILYIFYLAYPAIKKNIKHDKHISAGYSESSSKIAGELLGIAIPIILGTAVFSITNLIDTSMTMDRLTTGAGFSETAATDLFGQLSTNYVTLTNLPISISAAFATASIPSIASSNIIGDTKAVKNKINMVLRITMLLSIPAAVGLGVLSSQILQLLFPGHAAGADLLRIGAVSVIFLSITQITTGILQALGRVRIPVFASICGALVKIPVNYMLLGIATINVKGAVISTIIFYITTSIIDWYQLCKTTGMKPDFMGIIIKPLAASGVMGLVVYVTYYLSYYVLGKNSLSVVFSILCGVVSYIIMLVLIRGLNKDDLNQISFARRFVKYIK